MVFFGGLVISLCGFEFGGEEAKVELFFVFLYVGGPFFAGLVPGYAFVF